MDYLGKFVGPHAETSFSPARPSVIGFVCLDIEESEKNNGLTVLKLIKDNLVLSAHDISSGGMLTSLAEMSMASKIGLKIYKPKKLIDSIEYFFGEDQGRYLIEIDKNNRKKIESLLKENNIFSEVIAEVQNDIFEIEKTFSIKVSDLYNSNNQWYHKFNAIK